MVARPRDRSEPARDCKGLFPKITALFGALSHQASFRLHVCASAFLLWQGLSRHTSGTAPPSRSFRVQGVNACSFRAPGCFVGGLGDKGDGPKGTKYYRFTKRDLDPSNWRRRRKSWHLSSDSKGGPKVEVRVSPTEGARSQRVGRH